MKIKPMEVLRPTAILVALCVLITGAVAGANELTKDQIAQQQALKAEESRKIVLPEAEAFEECDYNGEFTYYIGQSADGEQVGMVFETSAKGYGGDVKVMTGVSFAGEVTGVVILEHSETPGLGANAEKENFREQYVGLSAFGDIEVVRYQTPVGQQIQAMTGASITSRAVTDAVNQALDAFLLLRDSYDPLSDNLSQPATGSDDAVDLDADENRQATERGAEGETAARQEAESRAAAIQDQLLPGAGSLSAVSGIDFLLDDLGSDASVVLGNDEQGFFGYLVETGPEDKRVLTGITWGGTITGTLPRSEDTVLSDEEIEAARAQAWELYQQICQMDGFDPAGERIAGMKKSERGA